MTMTKTRIIEASTEDINSFLNVYLSSRRSLESLIEDSIVQMLAAMNQLAAEVRARVLALIANPDDAINFTALSSIRAQLRSVSNEFLSNVLLLSVSEMELAAGFGSSVTANAFAQLGISTLRPLFNDGTLRTALLSRQNIFRAMTRALEERIISQVQSSVLGVIPTSTAIRNIDRILTFSEQGKRIGFGFQAEAIARTEIGGLFSEAQQAASEQIAETIPGLRKKWITTLGSRKGHNAVQAATAPGGSTGPIPIRDRFIVQDFSRTGFSEFATFRTKRGKRVVKLPTSFARRGSVITDRMLHPRDPSASAGNRVNCTCVVIEVLPDVDQQIERSKGIISEQEI